MNATGTCPSRLRLFLPAVFFAIATAQAMVTRIRRVTKEGWMRLSN
jgi:hypothetical protein